MRQGKLTITNDIKSNAVYVVKLEEDPLLLALSGEPND